MPEILLDLGATGQKNKNNLPLCRLIGQWDREVLNKETPKWVYN